MSFSLIKYTLGALVISPGSAISNSGTSSPFPDRRPILEFHMGEAPKLLGFENLTTRKWCSRLGSGSLTPDGLGPPSRDGFLLGSQISEVALLTNQANGPKNDETIVDHRVSFELSGEDVARCLESKSLLPSRTVSEYPKDLVAEGRIERDGIKKDLESSCELFIRETSNETVEKASGKAEEEHSYQKHRSVTLGSIKEFNFDNTKGEASDKPTIRSEWWANEKFARKEARPGNSWTFFPMFRPGVR
ncbi:hypothetical protein QUC31_008177 [Theobroma cacao]